LSICVAKSANCPESGRMMPILMVSWANAGAGETSRASAAAPLRNVR
jgi:hypothetical protein